jgi:hypothetical protein
MNHRGYINAVYESADCEALLNAPDASLADFAIRRLQTPLANSAELGSVFARPIAFFKVRPRECHLVFPN